MGLFALWFMAASIVSAAYFYVSWQATHELHIPSVCVFVLLVATAVMWTGGWAADHEALAGVFLYKVTSKDTVYDNARIVRASSSGFLISSNRKIVYLPTDEIKSIVGLNNL